VPIIRASHAPYALRAGNPSGEKGVKQDACLSIEDASSARLAFEPATGRTVKRAHKAFLVPFAA
jgi:hypothetical protein